MFSNTNSRRVMNYATFQFSQIMGIACFFLLALNHFCLRPKP